jgi:selT/selW/selH-like putative selenoprotein
LAAAIKQEFKCGVDLIPGVDGIFEVSVDGTAIFSKRQSVRFPKADEIVRALKSLRQRHGPTT